MTPFENKKIGSYRRSTLAVIGFMAICCLILIIVGIYSNINNTKQNDTSQAPNEIEKLTINTDTNTELSDTSATTDNKNVARKIISKSKPENITAKAYGVFYRDNKGEDFNDLYLYNNTATLPPASITKLMTAIVALEKYEIDKQVLVPSQCTNINGSSIGLKAFEVYRLEDLLYGLLVKSAADAGCSITGIEGSGDFVVDMNKKAEELGMNDTIFQNAIGFDAGASQLSSINDLKILATEALKSSIIRKIAGTRFYELKPINSSTVYRIENTNDLLRSIPGTVGLKTGFTDLAGECLIYVYEENGREIMIVILGSDDRFGNTKKLLDWSKKELGLASDQNANGTENINSGSPDSVEIEISDPQDINETSDSTDIEDNLVLPAQSQIIPNQ